MAESIAAQLALQAWLSPSYPIGAYAYSHGLEAMVEQGVVQDAATLGQWVNDNMRHGAGWNDAILINEAVRRVDVDNHQITLESLSSLARLASVMNATPELQQESLQQGSAFLDVTRQAWQHPLLDDFAAAIGADTAYPVCFGIAVAAHGCAQTAAVNGYLLAMASNWISAAVRMNIVGQTTGQQLAAQAVPVIERLAAAAAQASLDDLGGCTFLNEIASFQHQTQNARLFRS